MRTKELTRIALFAALTAVMAQIMLPLPFSPVPVSLATLAVMLCGGLLPPRQAWWAMVAYLLLGAVGLPVFSGFMGGPGRLVGPTGGYLLAYPFAACIIAALLRRFGRQPSCCFLAGAGLAALVGLAVGAAWLGCSAHLTPKAAFISGVLPFLPAEAAKALLAALLVKKLHRPLGE